MTIKIVLIITLFCFMGFIIRGKVVATDPVKDCYICDGEFASGYIGSFSEMYQNCQPTNMEYNQVLRSIFYLSNDGFKSAGDFTQTVETQVDRLSFSRKTYYLDATNGDDENNGQSPATAWKTWYEPV